MPHVHILTGGGSAQRRLMEATLKAYAARGYEDITRQEGGDWAALLTENSGGGLFGEKRVVVVDEAEKLGVLPERYAPLLEPKNAETAILLICKNETAIPVPKTLIPKCTLSKATEPSPWSKERDEIILSAAREQGVGVARDAVSLMKELFEDTGELAGETKKLALHCLVAKKKEISRADIETLCLSDGGKNLLKLLDGICAGKEAETLNALEALRKGSELLPLLSAIHNRIRLALYFAAHERESGLFARALGAKDYAMRQAETAVRMYGKASILRFTIGLITINANEKSGRGAQWRDLDLLVVELLSSKKTGR